MSDWDPIRNAHVEWQHNHSFPPLRIDDISDAGYPQTMKVRDWDLGAYSFLAYRVTATGNQFHRHSGRLDAVEICFDPEWMADKDIRRLTNIIEYLGAPVTYPEAPAVLGAFTVRGTGILGDLDGVVAYIGDHNVRVATIGAQDHAHGPQQPCSATERQEPPRQL